MLRGDAQPEIILPELSRGSVGSGAGQSKTMRLAKEISAGYIDILEQRFRGEIHHVPTGLADLDVAAPGLLHEGHLIVLAARPGMGKTTLGQQIGEQVAEQNRSVLFFSLEMSDYEIAERSFVRRGRVPMHTLRSGKLTETDWHGIGEAVKGFSPLPLVIDASTFDLAGIGKNSKLSVKALEKKKMPRLGLIVIDYLQLIASHGAANKNLEIGMITRGLKIIAKELSVPVLLLSQLNRETDHRPNHRPVLADLRDSGNIEQDADLVMFIYRDEAYNEDSQDKGIVEIIIRKNRHGPTGTARLAFLPERLEFAPLACGDYESGTVAPAPKSNKKPQSQAADERMLSNARAQGWRHDDIF